MKVRKIFFVAGLAPVLIAGAVIQGLSQAPLAQNRFPQQILISGQLANAVYVRNAAGSMQSYTCQNPQSYTTPDGASRGWACYDQSTATYLLNALPPAQGQGQAYPQPQPAPRVYSNNAPSYSYPSYPAYPSPAFGYPGRPSLGNVKIDTKIKNGSIYVDGGFAGTSGKLKKFRLTTGNHDIELRDSSGQTVLKERVQVITGKTIEIKSVTKKSQAASGADL